MCSTVRHVRVHAHDAPDCGGQVSRRLHNDRTARRMPDQHDLLQLELPYHRHHILREGGHGPLGPMLSRRSVPREIEPHHGIGGRKGVDLPIPTAAVATPTVDKHQRNGSVSLHVVMNGKTISRESNKALGMHG